MNSGNNKVIGFWRGWSIAVGCAIGSGIFMSEDPELRAKAVVEATTHYQDPDKVLKASTGLKGAMKGLDMSEIPENERLQERGW